MGAVEGGEAAGGEEGEGEEDWEERFTRIEAVEQSSIDFRRRLFSVWRGGREVVLGRDVEARETFGSSNFNHMLNFHARYLGAPGRTYCDLLQSPLYLLKMLLLTDASAPRVFPVHLLPALH